MPDPIPRNPNYRGAPGPRRATVPAVPRLPQQPMGAGRPGPTPASVAGRVGFDFALISLTFAACITVIVPWLIGHYLLRDRFGRTYSASVYDSSVRSAGHYFMTDFIAGTFLLVVVTGCIVLLGRNWRRRIPSIVIAIAMISGGVLWLRPSANNRWNKDEAQSASLLRSSVFPFSDHYATCGEDNVSYTDSSGSTYTISAFSATTLGSAEAGCNRVSIYSGWCLLKQIDLPSGDLVASQILNIPITSNADRSYVDGSLPNVSPEQLVFSAGLAGGGEFKIPLSNIDLQPHC